MSPNLPFFLLLLLLFLFVSIFLCLPFFYLSKPSSSIFCPLFKPFSGQSRDCLSGIFSNYSIVSVCLWSYGYMQPVAKHQKSQVFQSFQVVLLLKLFCNIDMNFIKFYQILVSPVIAYRHAFQWFRCAVSVRP